MTTSAAIMYFAEKSVKMTVIQNDGYLDGVGTYLLNKADNDEVYSRIVAEQIIASGCFYSSIDSEPVNNVVESVEYGKEGIYVKGVIELFLEQDAREYCQYVYVVAHGPDNSIHVYRRKENSNKPIYLGVLSRELILNDKKEKLKAMKIELKKLEEKIAGMEENISSYETFHSLLVKAKEL